MAIDKDPFPPLASINTTNFDLRASIESKVGKLSPRKVWVPKYCLLRVDKLKNEWSCHTPIPGPTRLAEPNRVRGARLRTGTLYLIFFFLKLHSYLWVWPTSYTRIKILYTNQKNYHQSGVHQNLDTYTESHLQIQNCTFTITNQSTEPTCSELLQVCWPSCTRKSSDVFSCTYTD